MGSEPEERACWSRRGNVVLLREKPKEREGVIVVWRPRRREGEEERAGEE